MTGFGVWEAGLFGVIGALDGWLATCLPVLLEAMCERIVEKYCVLHLVTPSFS